MLNTVEAVSDDSRHVQWLGKVSFKGNATC